jgi:Tol biopolymer transport system component/DNA-binding winged helix-turn-helix (wHTH) protein
MASSRSFPALRARFGRFQLDLNSRELLCSGTRVSIQDKPLQILRLLLEAEGQVVSREQIRAALWPEDTFVDFEHGVNTAVKKLRQALEDSAENPEYIETLPRMGYRFLVPVEWEEAEQTFRNTPSVVTMPSPPLQSGPHLVVHPKPRQFRGALLVATSVTAVVLVVGLLYLRRPLPPPRITEYTQLTHDGRDKFLAATDGTRIYFTQMSPRSINQIGVNGGETAPLPLAVSGSKIALQDVTGDGAIALIANYDTVPWSLWVTPVLGGSLKHVGDGEKAGFSPDGKSVIYSTVAGDVMVVRRDGSESRKVTNVGPGADGFRLSPDGRVIRFAKDDGLWEMAQDGSRLHRLLPDWREQGVLCCGRWTSDGHFYVFLLFNKALTRSHIWALDERRGWFRRGRPEPVQLTAGPIYWRSPFSSQDGKKIFANGANPRGELSRIDPKTGGYQPFLGGISAELVSFSQDGKSIAYVTYPEGSLWMADREGNNRVQLSEPPARIYNPRWSPDSKQIGFTTINVNGHVSTYVVSAAGGKAQWILPEDGVDRHDPNWSPDGTKVLFAWGTKEAKAGDGLRMVDLPSRQVQMIPDSSGKWSPRWSPDGRYIAALDDDSQTLIHVFDVKRQRWSKLELDGDATCPNFSRDSRFIYFLRFGRIQGVFRIPVTGGKVERVVDLKDWHLTSSYFASMTLDPDDAPLMMREVGNDDIYALTLEE